MVKKKSIADSTLVRDYIQGKEASLEILIKRHQQRLLNFIYSKVQDREVFQK